MILNSWSGPRNISTALMYSFAQRPNTIVIDEPLYAHYLNISKIEHPGKSKILKAQNTLGNEVLDEIQNRDANSEHESLIYLKQMNHHWLELNESFLENSEHFFLLRNPKDVLISFSKVIPNPCLTDIGIKQQFELYKQLQKLGKKAVIIDSETLLANPINEIKKLCTAIEINFSESMLKWPSGPKLYDGVWAPYWYTNVHKSTKFEKRTPSKNTLPKHLERINEEGQEYYNFLLEKAL